MSRRERSSLAQVRDELERRSLIIRRRVLQVLRTTSGVLATIVLIAVFLSAFVLGVLLHLPIPPSRRIATQLVTEQVSDAIRGSVQIEKITRLNLGGFEAVGVTIRDPEGEPILHAPRLRVRANLVSIGLSAMPWSDRVDIPVNWIRADHIDVVFRHDLDGDLTLGTAFLAPRKAPEPKPVTPPKPSKPVIVDLKAIEIGTIAAKGRLGGMSPDWRAVTVRGSVYAGPDGVRIDTSPFPLAFHKILPDPIWTTVDYHFRSPSLMWSRVLARYQELSVSGGVQLRGIEMLVDLDLPRTDGRVFAPYLPDEIVLVDPVEGKIEAHGPLPLLTTNVRLLSDRALVDGKGFVRLAPTFETNLDLDVRRLDLQRVVAHAPATDIDADLRARLTLDSKNRPRIRATGSIDATDLFGVSWPEAEVDALIDANGVTGLAHLNEPGMPVRADFTVSPDGKLRVSAVTNVPSLEAVPRLNRVVRGYAVAKLEGTYEKGVFDARAKVNAGNLAREGVRAGSANINVHAWGPPDALRMDSQFSGNGLNLAGMTWSAYDGSLIGPVKTPRLHVNLHGKDLPDVDLIAALDVRDRFAARGVTMKLVRGREEATLKSDQIEVRNGVVDLGGVAIDGLGEPIDVIARVGARGFDVRMVSDGVDLDRVHHMLGLPGPRLEGRAELDVDLRNVGDESRGCVRIDVLDGKLHTVAPLPKVDVSLRASFAGRHVDVDTNVSMGGKGEARGVPAGSGVCLPARPVREDGLVELRTSASLALGGTPIDPSSWRGATGTARLVRALVNLDRAEETLALWRTLNLVPEEVPVLGGVVELSGDVVRDRPDAPPAWSLAASTKALRAEFGRGSEARRVQGADLYAFASMHRGGLLHASACVRDDMGAYDTEPCDTEETNVLASLALLAELDYQRLYEKPGEWKAILYDTRIDSRVVVHDRPASALLRPLPLLEEELPVEADRASATVGLRGTILSPQVDYHVRLSSFGPTEASWRAATTICAQGQYDGERAWVHADLRRIGTRRNALLRELCAPIPADSLDSIGYVDGDVRVAWRDVLSWPSLPRLPWEGKIDAVIHRFNLADVPVLADNGVSGWAQLAGGIKGLGTQPEFDIQLGLERLRTGPTAEYDRGNIRVHTGADGLTGALALIDVDDRGEISSALRMSVETEQVRWEDGWAPTRDGSKPVDIKAYATKFKVGMLTPLVQPILSYVDGDLTGMAEATWSPAEGESRIHKLFFMLEDGAFQVPVIGQEFLSVTGIIQAAGSNRLFVERFRAQSLTGALAGRATLDMRGLDIEHVDASLWTKKDDKIRLTFEGIPVGDFYGDVNVEIFPGDEQHTVKLVFDKVHLDLPSTDLRSVQRLDDNADIRVVPSLEATDETKWTSTDERITPWVLTFETRSPAVLERSDMNFSVITPKAEKDRPVLVFPDPETGGATLRGHVVLYDGRVDVVGNFFELEENNARVIFEGDPGDPILNVTARWDAPDGTRVFADVTGPLRDPRIQFRSEPAMPQAQILALVLFGTQTEGSGTTTAGGTEEGQGSAARDVGGGVAAAGINMLLRDLSPVNVSTRIDTSRGQSPSPTVVLQVSRDVTAEATYVSEENALEKQDRYLLTFDWRFLRQWSLRITRGNAGTSILDVIWQHRY